MGAKGLKALVVDRRGKSADAIANPEVFKEAAKTFALKLKENPFTGQFLGNFGTAGILGMINAMGAFPSYNATKGVLDGWENISGETLSKVMKERGGGLGHMGCAQCAIHCSNIFNDSKGKYVTSSLEYETIWALGGMTGIKDLDTIARLDFLCDDIGLDTMNTGVAIAVAMDAGYKKFGDDQAALEMIEEIARGSEMGKIFGDGPEAVGHYFQHHRIPAVKGQSVAAYDPRAMQGLGVTYATSTMGADHTAGNVFGLYMAKKLDPLKPEGQVTASRGSQIAMAATDSIGMCILAAVALAAPEAGAALMQAISAKIGKQLEGNAIAELGMRTIKMEKEFNKKAGIMGKDNRLPEFYYNEALSTHNTVFEVKDDDLDTTLDF
jgi:aldehyde:ferredoxin oxidoreductase